MTKHKPVFAAGVPMEFAGILWRIEVRRGPDEDYRSVGGSVPRDGIVKAIKRKSYKRLYRSMGYPRLRWSGPSSFYGQVKDVWYEFFLEPKPKGVAVFDLYFQEMAVDDYYSQRKAQYKGDFYAARRVQLNKKQIRRAGLYERPSQLPQPVENASKRRRKRQ